MSQYCYFAVSPHPEDGPLHERAQNGQMVPFIYVKFGGSRQPAERQNDYGTHNPSFAITTPSKNTTGFEDGHGATMPCGTFMSRRIFVQHRYSTSAASREWYRVYHPDMNAIRQLLAGWNTNTPAYDFHQYTLAQQQAVADAIIAHVFPANNAHP